MLLARASVVVALTTLMNDVGRQRLTSLQPAVGARSTLKSPVDSAITISNGFMESVLNAFVLIVKLP